MHFISNTYFLSTGKLGDNVLGWIRLSVRLFVRPLTAEPLVLSIGIGDWVSHPLCTANHTDVVDRLLIFQGLALLKISTIGIDKSWGVPKNAHFTKVMYYQLSDVGALMITLYSQ